MIPRSRRLVRFRVDSVAHGLGHNKTDARRKVRPRIGPVGMHDEEWPACSAGAWSPHCRREVRPLAQAVTCRQHAAARRQAESSERPLRRRAARMARPARVRMRRRKPCVLARRRLFGWKVRLLTRFSVACGARRHAPTRSRVQSWGSTADCCCWRPQSASPWIRRHRIQARAMGMRKRSQTRSINDTGAAEGGSNRLDGEPIPSPLPTRKVPIFGYSSTRASRHAEGPWLSQAGQLSGASRSC